MDLHAGYAELRDATSRALSAADEQRHLLAWAPLVKRVVRQLSSQVGGAIDRDDMEQIGLMGLLEALRRYGEPDAGFPGFAMLRIRGSILDELRRQDWRPRSVRRVRSCASGLWTSEATSCISAISSSKLASSSAPSSSR